MGKLIERGRACIVDGCGSSDAAAVYEDEGKQYQICFSALCPKKGRAVWLEGYRDSEQETAKTSSKKAQTGAGDFTEAIEAYVASEHEEWAARGLSALSMAHYGVRLVGNAYAYPYFNQDQELVCLKYRPKDRKDFWSKGATREQPELLFGRESFKPGGKAVTVCTGENDAIATYEMFGRKYAAVSIPAGDGTALKACKANYEWLNSFDNIYLAFDADDSGKKAAQEVAQLFAGKAKIVRMDPKLKDANGYLMAGQTKEFISTWWAAEDYVPDGIVAGNRLWDRMNVPQAKPVCPWPLTTMNEKLYGIYGRRVYTITAGSGVGKSQFIRELTYWLFKQTNEKIGILMLEEAVEESALGIMSIHISKPLHVPTTQYTPEEYKQAYDETIGLEDNRFFFHDHFGSTSINNILDRVKYMVKVLGCKFIILDHLSIIVSGQQEADERKAIDEIMTKLRMFVQETGVTLFLISHLKRVQGKEYTEGAKVGVSDLRGSASIEQLSDCIIGLERNGQSKNQRIANTTNVRILKSRQFGQLGLTDGMYYDKVTGRMTETGIVDTTPEDEEL